MGPERCETYVLGHRSLHSTFGEQTKWSKFPKKTLALC